MTSTGARIRITDVPPDDHSLAAGRRRYRELATKLGRAVDADDAAPSTPAAVTRAAAVARAHAVLSKGRRLTSAEEAQFQADLELVSRTSTEGIFLTSLHRALLDDLAREEQEEAAARSPGGPSRGAAGDGQPVVRGQDALRDNMRSGFRSAGDAAAAYDRQVHGQDRLRALMRGEVAQ
jgi:hypothetical protein